MTNENDATERAYDLMEKIMFCMLTTRAQSGMRARPMAAHVERLENTIHFLTDVDSHKDDEIERNPEVCLAFADSKGQKYVSVSGRATILNDREQIRELFSTPAKAWWDNADDPSIRILKIEPNSAEYWDSPGTVVSYIKMIAAAVSDAKPNMGENEKVRLS